MLRGLERGLETALLLFSRFFLAAMVVVTIADIVLRNTVRFPIPGVVELVEFSLAVTIFAGLAVAGFRGGHLTVDLLEFIFPARILRFLDKFNNISTLLVNVILAWLCYERLIDALDWGDKSVSLRIPLSWFWLSPVIGFTGAAFYSLTRVIRQFHKGHASK